MEAWSDSQKVVISDSVRIAQGALKAQCRRATYWGKTGRLLLEFSPIVWQESQEMQADTIDMAIAKGKLRSGMLKGHAQVTSTDTSDQGSMTGRTIHFGAEQDSLREVWITGQATNVYHVPEEEETPGVNTFTGDRILLVFKGKELQRVKVLSDPGLSTGKFTPEKTSPAKPKEEKAGRESSRISTNSAPRNWSRSTAAARWSTRSPSTSKAARLWDCWDPTARARPPAFT